MYKKILVGIIFLGLAVGGVHFAVAGGMREVTSTLSGQVTWTAAVGTHVDEGSEVIRISTLTGSAAAARAAASGTVKEVLVHPGENVERGMLVARIAED